MRPEPHVLFISSWWPSPRTSEGTFVEFHLLALQSRGCRCAVMLNGETTMGNFLRNTGRRQHFLDFRRRADIRYIDNLTLHKLPLRFAPNPLVKRKRNILSTSERNLGKYIDQYGKPDVIFHHGVFNYAFISAHLSKVFEIPIYYMENSPKINKDQIPTASPFDTPETLIEFAKSAKRRFAVTQAYVEKMESVFKVPFELCPNVITDDFFVEKPSLRPKTPFIFCNVAILDERKNQALIIKAFAAQFKGKEEYRLVIAGDGNLLEPLRKLAQELGVEDQVKIPGYLDRQGVKDLLDRSHVFLLASHAETFGVVVIEAMARGIPVISSDIDGTREIITAENGVLFEPGNQSDLMEKMKYISENYQNYDPVSIINSVKRRFGSDAVKNTLFPHEG